MIIELNPINEFLITPVNKSLKIHIDNHLGIEINCINYIDYTKVPIPLLSYFRKSSSPLVLVSSLDFSVFDFRGLFTPHINCKNRGLPVCIFMYCLFSDNPRFSDSLLTDQMCH